MLKNYIKTAWRSLLRYKIFTLINMAGLAIGISAALVIYLVVSYDFNFDHFEKDADRIYRVVTDFKFSGVPYHNSGVLAPMANTLRNEATGLSEVAPFHQYNYDVKVAIATDKANAPTVFKKQPDIIFADGHYFKLIDYEWLVGSATASLNQPFAVVLTQKRAQQYFPNQPVNSIIGKQIIYNDSVKVTVAGIVKNLSHNSDFVFQEFISLKTISSSGLKRDFNLDSWGMTNGSSQLYVKLAPGTTVQQIEKQLAGLLNKYEKRPHKPDAQNYTANHLQPLSDVHFNSDYGTYNSQMAHKPTLYGLLIVATFLLLLGCINFINLSTAHASQRAKEIGIRKTLGSSKTQLMFQFLSETFLVTLLATILSIASTPLLLNVFAGFIPPGVHLNLLQQPGVLLFIVLLVILVSVLSGFYPAWILSRYNPVLVLKNQAYANTGTTRRVWVRKTLTVFQFLIAQVFIMATLMVSKQIYYTLNKDLGFKKDAILSFSAPYFDKHKSNRQVLLNELKAIPQVAMVSLASDQPSSGNNTSGQVKYVDGKQEIQTDMQFKWGDANFLKLFNIRLLAGRDVLQSDTSKQFVVNETYVHILGFKHPADAVNKYVEWGSDKVQIVGVMADFHQQSLHKAILPLAFMGASNDNNVFNVALKPQNADGTAWKTAIAQMKDAYHKIYPGEHFEYEFYDASIAKFYKSEQNIDHLLKWATGLAIFISCLGLLGLVIFTTNLRIKEIGIRKVLGASVAQIVTILSTEFVQLVLIAFAVATPITWMATNNWLQNFAYRTSISWWVFALSGIMMIFIAVLTLSAQTIRVATTNPVKSLRSE